MYVCVCSSNMYKLYCAIDSFYTIQSFFFRHLVLTSVHDVKYMSNSLSPNDAQFFFKEFIHQFSLIHFPCNGYPGDLQIHLTTNINIFIILPLKPAHRCLWSIHLRVG